MKVKIYVDWEYREVISSADEKERIMKGYIEEAEDDKLNHAGEYLDDLGLSLTEILYATETQREEWKKGIDNFIKDIATDDFNEHYEEIEVEI